MPTNGIYYEKFLYAVDMTSVKQISRLKVITNLIFNSGSFAITITPMHILFQYYVSAEMCCDAGAACVAEMSDTRSHMPSVRF